MKMNLADHYGLRPAVVNSRDARLATDRVLRSSPVVLDNPVSNLTLASSERLGN